MATRTKTDPNRADTGRGRPLRTAAAVVGAIFLLVGILGFIPGITTNYDQLQFAGPPDMGEPHAELLGLFHVSVLHNLVHLLFGVGILMARSVKGAAAYLIGGGLVYAVVLLYGIAIDQDSDWNFLPVNTADNWLHLGLAVGMVGLGMILTPSSRAEDTTPAR